MSAEAIARHIFDLAGIAAVGEAGIAHVAEQLFGEENLDFAEQFAFVVLLPAPWRLLVRTDLCDEDLTIALAHGIAEWWLRTHPAERCDLRELADALVVPGVALREAVDRLGDDVEAIADEFVIHAEIVERRLRVLPALGKGSGVRERAAS